MVTEDIEKFRQGIMNLTTHYENVVVDGGVVCGIDKNHIEKIQIGVNNLIAENARLRKIEACARKLIESGNPSRELEHYRLVKVSKDAYINLHQALAGKEGER